jgi:peptidyl-prolyl cis-trans isomerase SurA
MAKGAANASGTWWLGWLCALLLAAAPLRAGEIIDRIVATVDNDVVLESDLDVALRFQALVKGTPAAGASAAESAQELQRLIDQSLLRAQMSRASFPPASQDEISKAVADLRARIPGAATPEGWQAALTAAGLSERDVEERVTAQIEISHFIDLRFRPGIRVDDTEVSKYYDETLLPELRAKGAAVPPLKDVSGKIQELLVEKNVNEQLDAWLKSLRSESRVRILDNPATAEAGAR